MAQLRYLILLLSIYAMNVYSCESPYELKIGGFSNSASVVSFWSDFTKSISSHTLCPTNIVPAPNSEAHILSMMKLDGDMFFVPGYYAAPLKKYGLKPILKISTPTKSYLVTRKELDPTDVSTLIGKKISIVSKYSNIYFAMIELLTAKGISEDQVNFIFDQSLESNAMNIIKGDTDAAVVFSMIFDNLPDIIKQKVNHITLMDHKTTGYLLIKEDAPINLVKAIKASFDKINILKWEIFEKDAPETEFSDTFESRLLHLKHTP